VWSAESGEGFRCAATKAAERGDHKSEHLRRLGTGLTAFADEIDEVLKTINLARANAKAAGLVLTAAAIHLPYCAVEELAGDVHPAFAAAAEKVKAARERERRAHEDLWTMLVELSTLKDFFEAGDATRKASIARTLYNDLASATKIGHSAAVNKSFSDAAFAVARDGSLPWAMRANALHAGTDQAGLFLSKVAAGKAIMGTKRMLQAAPPGISKVNGVAPVTVSGGLIAGVGVGVAIMNGAPADRAIVTGAAGFAGAALTTVALGVGPPGWVVLAVGTAVSTGVGYFVDQNWDSIKDGVGDAVDGVKDFFGW
jgi:hypothetical protein